MATETPVPAPSAASQPQVKMLRAAAPPEEVYVDGAFSFMNRTGVVKIDLYRVAGYERGEGNTAAAELRQHSHRLVLPLSGLVELTAMLQRSLEAMGAARQAKGAAPAKKA